MVVQGDPALCRASGEPPLRFVILHHTGCGQPHWDWFFEESQALAGWRVYHDPVRAAKVPLELFRESDHRKLYLDFEGPLAGGRGIILRVAAGTYWLQEKHADCWRGVLQASALSGPFELRRTAGPRWLLSGPIWKPG